MYIKNSIKRSEDCNITLRCKLALHMAYLTSHILMSADDKSCSPDLHLLTAKVYNSWITVSSSGLGKTHQQKQPFYLDHRANRTSKNAQEENIEEMAKAGEGGSPKKE